MLLILSTAVLDAKPALWISPFDRAINAGDHASAAFETTSKFYGHLALLGQGVKISRAGIDTEAFLTRAADLLIEKNMGLLIILKGVEGQLL